MFQKQFLKYFSCICALANTGPTGIHAKINSLRFFPACNGFVTEGNFRLGPAKTYTLRGTPQTYATKLGDCDRPPEPMAP